MDPQRWQQVRQLFEATCDLAPEERERALASACEDDADLRAEVESILASSGDAPTFVDEPAAEAFPELFTGERDALVGRRVGDYRLDRYLASGGMGTVYLARRTDPDYPRPVAVKLIRRRIATPDILDRFRAERAALARLDHPNIARLLDGAVTSDGLPYLVMEYVEGKPIDQFCDDARLSTQRRLELFLAVCSAVLYAHQNLIVHRDLKPGNILVTGDRIPKLLDFGIAKVLEPDGRTRGDGTRTSNRIMTPEYASPEQIRGEPITTASDVYSLGVVLYELLTGHRPYKIKSRVPHEIERTICEEDPEKPSTAVRRIEEVFAADGSSRVTLTPELVSSTRDERPESLRRRLSGDLDAIVLMALRKDPTRRYASVQQFTEDIRRHLEGLPVTAQHDTFTYRAGKFVRRNRVAVIGACAVAISLIGGIGATAWQTSQATAQAQKANSVNAFLQQMLASVEPASALGREATVRRILDQAAKRIADGALAEQPDVEAELRMTLGNTYLELGRYEESDVHLGQAYAIRKRIGSDAADLAETINARGVLRRKQGKYGEAEAFYREALAIRESGESDLNAAETMNNLGVLLKKKGELDEAETLYRRALAIREQHLGKKNEEVATTMTNLAAVMKTRGNLDEAETLYREALSVLQINQNEPMLEAACANNLALLLRERGRLQEATQLLRGALEIRRTVLGEKHPGVATGLHNLALLLTMRDLNQDAEPLYREALAIRRETLGPNHPKVAYTASNLADLLVNTGGFAEAEALSREALAIREKKLKPKHPVFAATLASLGRAMVGQGNPDEAEPLLRESLDIVLQTPGQPPRGQIRSKRALGHCLVQLEKFEEAESLLLDSFEMAREAHGAEHFSTVRSLNRLVELYEDWQRPEAASRYRDMLAARGSD